MYRDSQLNITTQVLEYDRGGGGQAFSFSSNAPTVSVSDGPQEKRFRRGDVNTSDGRIFWCYERDKRVDGSIHIRERWVTPEQFERISQRKRQNDRKHVPSEATKQKRKVWAMSERGKALRAASRSKPENREKARGRNKKYRDRSDIKARESERYKRPEVRQKYRERYAALKQDEDRYEKTKERSREWYRNNKERAKELQRRWHERNPGRANQLCKAYVKRRYAEDPEFALAYRLRSRVYQAIKAGGASKGGCTEELVGCSIEFLRQHIERQFKGKMSWDNPGSFHIDHIVPVSSFDLTNIQQQRVAFNWQNMRPIPPKKNMSKGAKLTEPQLPLPLTVQSTTTYSL